jgi:thioredoxin reductase (NADPH)
MGGGRRIDNGLFRQPWRRQRPLYRKPALENLSRFEGAGCVLRRDEMGSQLCVGDDVVVIGGGNSAGQAAVFLAQTAKRVQMLVRGNGLADTMSRYLVRRIEDNPG